MPGLPGGLPYPGAVPGREWVLQPGAAWGVPGAAIAPHGAAVHGAPAPLEVEWRKAGADLLAGTLHAQCVRPCWFLTDRHWLLLVGGVVDCWLMVVSVSRSWLCLGLAGCTLL